MTAVAPFTYSGGNLVFVVEGRPYKVSKSDRNFSAVAKALQEGKYGQELLDIFKVGANLRDVLPKNGRISFDGSNVYIDGQILHDSIVQKVRDIADAGLPIAPILKFIENIEKNPSFNSRNQLYGFLEHSDIALTDDGCFVAYKAVRSDYFDKYTGKIYNGITGKPVTMDRSKIDDNVRNHCSAGLHVGSIKYAGEGGFYHNYGDRTMLVKVNPQNVVSVPDDFSCQKCRVCEYLVIGEVDKALEVPLYTAEGKPYEVKPTTAAEFSGFDYDDDDYEDSDVYDCDEDDDYDSEFDNEESDLPEEIDLN
jgi:hypothetical protein